MRRLFSSPVAKRWGRCRARSALKQRSDSATNKRDGGGVWFDVIGIRSRTVIPANAGNDNVVVLICLMPCKCDCSCPLTQVRLGRK